ESSSPASEHPQPAAIPRLPPPPGGPARRRRSRRRLSGMVLRAIGPTSPLSAAVDLVLPRSCAGCGAAGDVICPACRRELADLALPDRGPVAPRPVPSGWPGCTGVLRYEGVAS